MEVARKRKSVRRRQQGVWQLKELEKRIMLAGDVAVIAGDSGATLAPAAEFATQVAQEAPVGLVFVSSDAPQVTTIVEGMEAGHEFVMLDPDRSGLAQIAEHLRSRSRVASVHIVAHGESGRIVIGNQTVTTQTLIESQAEIRTWARALTPGADILLYGCDVASDVAGQRFVRHLAQLTGADVAASTDMTGNRQLGGDWDLEFAVGSIESGLAINEVGRSRFEGILPITIRAAGVTNDEQMLLQIDGVTVATFDNIGGSAYGGIFETYTHNVDGASADDVRIVFTNDLVDPVTGADRNLRIDNIDIDGVTYETEDPSVFSTGTWLPADGIVPGFRQSEYLHSDGYFQFAEAEPNDGSVIQIRANGTEGPESMELRIDGSVVQTWSAVGTTAQTFSYVAADEVTASQVRVSFTNDLWDPAAGIDRNLVVDWIEIDGTRQETEDPSVFSTGSWLPSDGIVPGFRQSEVLNANGYFQYADQDQVPNDGSLIVVYANGAEGDENFSLQIDGSPVASWSAIGTGQQSFAYTAADVVTADQIRVAFTNDLWNPATDTDRNLIVDRITVDGVNYETEHPSVYSTASWLPADGIVPGFRQSEVLNSNGYFQYASQLTPEPGTISVASTVVAVDESAASVSLTVNRTGGSDGEVSVSFATTDGSATQGEDYVAASDTLTFLDGETVKTIVVNLLPDVVDEPDEDFAIALSNATGGATILDGVANVTIVDDDGVPAPGILAIAPARPLVNESSTSANFVVTRTGGSDGEVSVSYSTADATAQEGIDYTAANGTLTFAAGETSKTLSVTILGDNLDEPDESFSLTLSGATGGAALGNSESLVMIIDDDQATLGGNPIYSYNGHLYLTTTTATTWGDADFEASNLGGNLVTINDAGEEQWLKQTFGSQSYWIGFRENLGTGDYQWASGEPVTYTNWAPGQPDDFFAEHFTIMNWQGSGQWNNEQDVSPFTGIIEIGSEFSSGGPTVPNGTGFSTELVASGLNEPVAFAEASDGRIFVNEKSGVVRVIENGVVLPDPFLDINLEVNSYFDRGMMGISLDPDFENNGYVYLQYAVELDPANPDNPDFNTTAGGRLIRVTASATDPNVADPNSRVVIQDGHQMSHATHAVGDIDFDNAGNLIYTWGDGGFDPALRLSTQDPTSPQGKLFRINPVTFEGLAENPFYDANDPTSIASRVWAVGIRNSWKIDVDRVTGDVYLGEVTDSGPEEINVMRADGSTVLNYGWPYYEDTNRTPYGTVPQNFVYESALVALPHTDVGGGDAIVGGTLFRGGAYPAVYDGRLFFGNFNQGLLYTADQTGDFQQFGAAGDYLGAVDVQLASDGHIWVMSLLDGTIERLVYDSQAASNTQPVAAASVNQSAGQAPLQVTLDASASQDDDGDALLYAWDFESDGVVDALGPLATHVYGDIGRTTTTLIVSDGKGGTDVRVVEIDALAAVPPDGNLAFGRAAIQSETDDPAIASRAVDGNVSGVFSEASVAQTVQIRTPLWEVDLGAVYDIGSLEIYSRTDGVNPLSNYWILISENPFSSGNLDAAQNDPGVWLYHEPAAASPLESIAAGTLGRYVRIQLEGVDDVLALAEVKIFAT